ncbi:MAG TPA: hypothetical protein VHF05_00525, partial [Candidatus Paceibacterota bacterium]|nr:hypothetical protein [Candidatus Paceibacterota bacterium]
MRHTLKQILAQILLLTTTFTVPGVFDLSLIPVPVAEAATFNTQINYQGKLADSSNVAVADGTYQMSFSLYTAATGGSPIWTESWSGANKVQVTSGLFSVMLGSHQSLSGVNFNQPLYLGVTIESDSEMTPRKALGAVPAAFEAQHAASSTNSDLLDNLSSTQFFRSDAANATSSASTFLSVTQNGAGKIAEFFGPSSNSVFSVLSNGNVGIGSSTPSAKLVVNGSTIVAGTLTVSSLVSTSTATSTFGGGIALSSGCFSIAGICMSNWSTTTSDSWLATKTTDNLTEGSTNLYFTNNRVAAVLAGTTTDALAEGSTNLYFTSARVANYINSSSTIANAAGTSVGELLTWNGTRWTAAATSTLGLALSDTIGTLAVGRGGTGINTAPTFGQILVGNSSSGYTLMATSSLGFLTTNVAEGTNLYFTNARVASVIAGTTTDALAEGSTNLYFTNARADARINATSTIGTITSLPNLALTSGNYTNFGTPFYQFFSATTTSALAEGSNLYFTNARADSRFVTDLAGTSSINSITALNNLATIGTNGATTTVAGGLGVSSSAVVTGSLTAASIISSGSATSTFAGGIALSSGCFSVNGVCLSSGTNWAT